MSCYCPCDCLCACPPPAQRPDRGCQTLCPAAAQFDRDCMTAADDVEEIATREEVTPRDHGNRSL